jgi:ribosomal protein L40E
VAKNRVYYIRKNATSQIPNNLLFLDTETKPELIDGVELHHMYMAWTWRLTLDAAGTVTREHWQRFDSPQPLYDYVNAETREKAPLCVIGSNITFDLFASGILECMEADGWECETLYDKGLVTILICTLGGRKLKFLAAQNWLQGGVKQWGELVGLPKKEVDLESDNTETVSAYCRRDTEITGRVVLGYLGFVRAHDMGGFALTAAGQAFRAFRHRFMKPKSILHYDSPQHNDFTRAAYYGGRVECGVIGSREGQFVKLDINSMYPHVMRQFTYPAKLKQWSRSVNVEGLAERIKSLCCIAEVELDTDEPAYAIRKDNKLLFPVGQFTAMLCTESIRYALQRGHIKRVKQVMTFTPARLFEGYVDYFYPLKQEYQEEGNAVWEKTVKIMLNGLYGKFGEKRNREIVREHIPNVTVSREIGLYNVDDLETEHPEYDWRLETDEAEARELVPGVCWSLLHTRVTEVGVDEGPGSAPAIAAHVTDYARMLLYKYMRQVGLDRVVYVDTDSLIIKLEDLHRLHEDIHATDLGKLKIEGRASTVEIRGAKDYSFGDDLHRKGIRAGATRVCRQCGERVAGSDRKCRSCGSDLRIAAFKQVAFPGFYTLLRRGLLGGFPIGTVTKSLTATYGKGEISPAGDVSPLTLKEG